MEGKYIKSFLEGRYMQFRAGEDSLTRQNGPEPLKINTSNLLVYIIYYLTS